MLNQWNFSGFHWSRFGIECGFVVDFLFVDFYRFVLRLLRLCSSKFGKRIGPMDSGKVTSTSLQAFEVDHAEKKNALCSSTTCTIGRYSFCWYRSATRVRSLQLPPCRFQFVMMLTTNNTFKSIFSSFQLHINPHILHHSRVCQVVTWIAAIASLVHWHETICFLKRNKSLNLVTILHYVTCTMYISSWGKFFW